MIRVYDMEKLLAEVEMIDGKIRIVDYDGRTARFIEDLRPRQAKLKAFKKAERLGIKASALPKSEWEPVSDQELYDSLPEHFGHHMWCERED